MSGVESDDTKEDKKGNNNDELPSPVGGVRAASDEYVHEETTAYTEIESRIPIGIETSKLTKRSFKVSKTRKSKKKSAKAKKKNIKKKFQKESKKS
jgi:hypothetical protein